MTIYGAVWTRPGGVQTGPASILGSTSASSHVRVQGVQHNYPFPPQRSGPVRKVCTAGDRTRRRRLNKLSCAGWLPHDRGFVLGLPRSKGRASVRGPAHNRRRGFPTAWSCLRRRAPWCAPPLMRLRCFFDDGGQPSSAGCVNWAIAQMKPTISRAIAVVTMTLDLPVAASRR